MVATVTNKTLETVTQLSRTFAERAKHYDETREFPSENYADMHAAGYLAASVPTGHGGWGMDIARLAETQRVLARGCASTAWSVTMHFEILMSIERGGTEAGLMERLYRDIIDEGAVMGGAFSEPQLGSNNNMPGTRAVAAGDGEYELTGTKYFCTQGPGITWFFVNTYIEEEDVVADFVFHRDSAGYELVDNWDTLGMRATASHHLNLHGVRVPASNCVGRRPPGLVAIEAVDLLGPTDILNSSVALGIADAAYDFAVDFARERRPGPMPRPVGHFPGIQFRIGEMRKTIEAASAFLASEAARYSEQEVAYRYGERMHERDVDETLARLAMVKLFVQDAAVDVVNDAMKVVGAASASRSFPLERYYRDVRLPIFQPISTDRGLEYAGKHALDIPLDHQPRWMN